MADDARICTALPHHPKTVKLQRRLGTPACWSLVCLFLWTADNRADGDLAGMSAEDIEIAAGWTGTDGEFAKALADVGFLDGEPGGHRIHDWMEHNPWAATRPARVECARNAAFKRWEKRRGAKRPDATRNAESCDPHESAMPSTTHHDSPLEVKSKRGATAPPATRVPEDFKPDEKHAALAKELGVSVDRELVKFIDYYRGMPGAKGTKADWPATFRNWLRKSEYFTTDTSSKSRPSDAHFVGHAAEQGQTCPFGECDGAGWWADETTRNIEYCRCHQPETAKAETAKAASA